MMILTVVNNKGKPLDYMVSVCREVCTKKTLRQSIKNGVNNFGHNININSSMGKGNLTVSFAEKKGYLLAESLHEYFFYPEALLYLEYLSEKKKCMVLFVENSEIVLDDFIDLSEVGNYLKALEFPQNIEIKFYGFELSDYFTFDANKQLNTIKVNSSAINDLEPNKKWLLKDSKEALLLFYTKKYYWIVLSIMIIGVVGWAYNAFFHQKPEPIPLDPQKSVPVDVYKDYKNALSKPTPAQELQSALTLYQSINSLYPFGWSFNKLVLSQDNTASIYLTSLGNNADQRALQTYADSNRQQVKRITSTELALIKQVNLKQSRSINEIMNLNKATSDLINAFNKSVDCHIVLGKLYSHQSYQQQGFVISCTELSLGYIAGYVEPILSAYPIMFDGLSIKSVNDMLDINLKLSLLGN